MCRVTILIYICWSIVAVFDINFHNGSCICCFIFLTKLSLYKVRPLFTLSHRGSENSPLLIVFSANYIDQSTLTFIHLKVFRKLWPFDLSRLRARGDTKTYLSPSSKIEHCVMSGRIMMQYANYKVHTKFTWTRSVMGSYQISYAIA